MGTSFQGATFDGVRMGFIGAQFNCGLIIFVGAHFNNSEQTSFWRAQFNNERTDFTEVRFSGGHTSFLDAEFNGELTLFLDTQFSGSRTSFTSARFSGETTSFLGAQFNGEDTSFLGAQFSDATTYFQQTSFMREVDFTRTTFKEKATFWGSDTTPVFGHGAWVRFNEVQVERPELLTFNALRLHPGWFINSDVRRVNFTDIQWYGIPGGPKGTLEEEIDALKQRGVASPHTLLAQACRRLSANAEENREYPLANAFHYWSMDALRKQGWTHLGLIGTLYWALSGYGVRATRAFLVLIALCAAFAVLYMVLGPDALRVSSASTLGQAIEHGGQATVYSLSTMARLNPEPKPNPGLFQFLVTIEGILGPLQIALLALAIRRKVMR